MKLTRRRVLQATGVALATTFLTTSYAFGVEPFRLALRSYHLSPPRWPAGLSLTIAALADIHACQPWMNADRIRSIVDATNALNPDLVVLLGDYAAGHRFVTEWVPAAEWAGALAPLAAPLGVHAILGNHDWWEDGTAQRAGAGPVVGQRALQRVGIPVLENDVVRLQKDGQAFWLAGLGDQLALLPARGWGRRRYRGVDDLPGTLAKVRGEEPVILLAHEPDVFPQVPERVSLTLSGHTHGGQVRLFGFSPVVPSRFANRYAYGHVMERGPAGAPKHLIVSGGLGCSIMPVRIGVPPEITLITVQGRPAPVAS